MIDQDLGDIMIIDPEQVEAIMNHPDHKFLIHASVGVITESIGKFTDMDQIEALRCFSNIEAKLKALASDDIKVDVVNYFCLRMVLFGMPIPTVRSIFK